CLLLALRLLGLRSLGLDRGLVGLALVRLRGLGVLGHPRYLILARSPPAWPLKRRVGANSPSLCPTIDSEMKTGTCLRPSWTAMVWPTISGKIVDARDHVLIICLSPEVFIASIRRSSRSSAHGPFLDDRDTGSDGPSRASVPAGTRKSR